MYSTRARSGRIGAFLGTVRRTKSLALLLLLVIPISHVCAEETAQSSAPVGLQIGTTTAPTGPTQMAGNSRETKTQELLRKYGSYSLSKNNAIAAQKEIEAIANEIRPAGYPKNRIVVINSPIRNAYIEGNPNDDGTHDIVLFKGVFRNAISKDRLVGVIAHEIAHSSTFKSLGSWNRRVQQQREEIFTADVGAMEIMLKHGYDPREYREMLLEVSKRYDSASASLDGMLGSHPVTEIRITKIDQWLSKNEVKLQNLKPIPLAPTLQRVGSMRRNFIFQPWPKQAVGVYSVSALLRRLNASESNPHPYDLAALLYGRSGNDRLRPKFEGTVSELLFGEQYRRNEFRNHTKFAIFLPPTQGEVEKVAKEIVTHGGGIKFRSAAEALENIWSVHWKRFPVETVLYYQDQIKLPPHFNTVAEAREAFNDEQI